MSQLINFKDFSPNSTVKENTGMVSGKRGMINPESSGLESEEVYKLTLNILVHNHPGKECFSLKEAGEKLGVGEEFIRRGLNPIKLGQSTLAINLLLTL